MHGSSRIVQSIPIILMILLIVFEGSYNSLLHFGRYTPFYEMTLVFLFVWFVPNSFSILVLVLLGFFRDFILLSPMWMSAVSFVLMSVLVNKEKTLVKTQGFPVILLLFFLNITIISLLQIAFLMISYDMPLWFLLKLFCSRIISSLILYVPIYCLFHYLLFRGAKLDDV